MSEPMPVTTSIITHESGSTSRLKGTRKLADLDPAQRLALLEGGERGPAEGGLGEAQALGSPDVAVEPDRGPGGEAERREDGGAGQVPRPRRLPVALDPVAEEGEDDEAREREEQDREGKGAVDRRQIEQGPTPSSG